MNQQLFEERKLSLRNSCLGFLMAYEQRNVSKMLTYCQPQGTVHFTPLGDAGKGLIHELGKGLWSALIEAFPDLENTVTEVVIAPDGRVTCQVIIKGTQQSEFAGIPSCGKEFDSDHIFIFRLEESNLISDISITWDHQDFRRQLGV